MKISVVFLRVPSLDPNLILIGPPGQYSLSNEKNTCLQVRTYIKNINKKKSNELRTIFEVG